MAKITIEDLKKIKERVHAETALRDGHLRVKVTVHLTCSRPFTTIASRMSFFNWFTVIFMLPRT